MREMELTTLLTEVQDIQKFTKNRQQKNGGLREISPFGRGSNPTRQTKAIHFLRPSYELFERIIKIAKTIPAVSIMINNAKTRRLIKFVSDIQTNN